MPKPIVVLYLPDNDYFGPETSPMDLMAVFNYDGGRIKMPPMFYDYLWFVFVNREIVAPELKVFHEKDYTQIQYDDLRKMLEEGILYLKTNNK
jgi:hypothetical protein